MQLGGEVSRVSVIGLGYVGTASAACLAHMGHTVVGVDTNATKVELINAAKSPIVEKDVPGLIAGAVQSGRLRATLDIQDAIDETDITLICVGTPSRRNGNLDATAIEHVCIQIGEALSHKKRPHVVVVRSTVLPGTMRQMVIPTLERTSNEKAGEQLLVCNNPEFLREGTAVEDFFHPPKTVIGGDPLGVDAVAALYDRIPGPIVRTSLEVAEMLKYANNCWHALKVAFANEMGNICKDLGIDSHAVMEIFVQDHKLNISPSYLKPGFAFGGSCLPKDLRALTYLGRSLSLELPLLNSIIPSNRVQIDRAVERIVAYEQRAVSVLGFSFKSGTDDLRESPQVEVIERLIGKGYDLKLYDRNVELARLTGANRKYILETIPHIASLMTDSLKDAVAHGGLVIIGNNSAEFSDVPAMLREDQHLFDFVRLSGAEYLGGHYEGLNW